MKKKLIVFLSLLSLSIGTYAQEVDSTQLAIDAIEKSLVYTTGIIELEEGNAKLNVPKGFRYLDRKQSIYVLTELWGNPEDKSVLGMLVPEDKGVMGDQSWVFTITYDNMGYVKDDDAEDIDYDELLKEQQKEILEGNPERVKAGYEPVQFIGWAAAPFYNKDKKVLHWAKEIKFGEQEVNTLNYNLRILGRKGIYIINAIASMNELPEVKANIDKVLGSVQFKEGSKYADFDSNVDEVAAWTIGGLVAGKVLAKVGFLAVILKFWKLIAIAVAGGGAAVWRFFTGRKKNDENAPKLENQ